MKKFKIIYGKETIRGKVPDKFNELTVKQWSYLRPNVTDTELMSILTGIDKIKIENSKVDLTEIVKIVYEGILQAPEDFNNLEKKPIYILGKKIKFPKNLNFTTFGQKAMATNAITECEDLREIVSDLIAIYAQPSIDGQFDSTKVERVKNEVDNMPLILCWPWAVFFLKKSKMKKKSLLIDYNLFQKLPSK